MWRHRMRGRAGAAGHRGLDKGQFAQGQHDAAHQPHHARDLGDGDREDHVLHAGAWSAPSTRSRAAPTESTSARPSPASRSRRASGMKPVTRPIARPSAVASSATAEPDGQRYARAVDHAAVDVAPSMSVPNQCCADGRRSRRIGDRACGSTVPSQGAKTPPCHQPEQHRPDDDGRMPADIGRTSATPKRAATRSATADASPQLDPAHRRWRRGRRVDIRAAPLSSGSADRTTCS